MHPTFEAQCEVWCPGYEWKERREIEYPPELAEQLLVDENRPDWWLFLQEKADPSKPFPEDEREKRTLRREFNPFDNPALFHEFAATEASLDGIRRFADQYGQLRYLEIRQPTTPFEFWLMAPSLAYWKHNIALMRVAIAWWGKWRETGRNWSTEVGQNLLAFLNAYPMSAAIQKTVTRANALAVKFVVKDLASALYLQLTTAIIENTGFKKCAWGACGRMFAIQHDRPGQRRGRSDKEFCSDSCRQKAYLQRRRAATQLRDEGKNLREIAKAVDTDLETLKKWIGAKK